MTYKFNNGNGAILCDICRIIVAENLSWEEYKEANKTLGHLVDVCSECFNKLDKEEEND